MGTHNRFRFPFSAGTSGRDRQAPQNAALGISMASIVALSIVFATAPAAAQDPPPSMTVEERDAWLSTPEGEHWVSEGFQDERVACVMMEDRVDILRTVVEQVLLGQSHEEDPEGLDAVRRTLESEPFQIDVWKGPPWSRFEAREIDSEDAAALADPLHAELSDRGLEARGLSEEAPYQISVSHPGSAGLWVSSYVSIDDLGTGEPIFSSSAKLARVGGEWRFMGWGSGMFLIDFDWDGYQRYPCPQ